VGESGTPTREVTAIGSDHPASADLHCEKVCNRQGSEKIEVEEYTEGGGAKVEA